MIRFAICLSFLGVILAVSARAADFIDPVLGERKVVGVVEFPLNSNALDSSSKAAIASILPQLERIDTNKRLIRIEGFARPTENESTALAIDRARVVVEWLNLRSDTKPDCFITGLVIRDDSGQTKHSPSRAEIVVYGNLFTSAGEPFETSRWESN